MLADNEQVYVEVAGCEEGHDCFSLRLKVKNRTEAQAVIRISEIVLDGYAAGAAQAFAVQAGEAEEQILTWDELDIKGIYGDVSEVRFRLDATVDEETVTDEHFKLYPQGETEVVVWDREPDDSDIDIIDNDEYLIVIEKYGWGEADDFGICLYAVNNTDKAVILMAQDVQINGMPVQTGSAFCLPAEAHAFTDFVWTKQQLTESGVTDVQIIEMNFKVLDMNGEEIRSVPVTLNY